jgi:hypothetical protein
MFFGLFTTSPLEMYVDSLENAEKVLDKEVMQQQEHGNKKRGTQQEQGNCRPS